MKGSKSLTFSLPGGWVGDGAFAHLTCLLISARMTFLQCCFCCYSEVPKPHGESKRMSAPPLWTIQFLLRTHSQQALLAEALHHHLQVPAPAATAVVATVHQSRKLVSVVG